MQFDQSTRRELITLLGAAAVAWPLAARAQQPGKLPRIGVLVSASPPHPFADAFWRGLHALGYSEGQNIKVEFRYTEARSDRAEEFADEFVQLGVNVIVAHFAQATGAAMEATRTIPIVMAPHGAPLQMGIIDSLDRPGGNVTGLSGMDARSEASPFANSFRTLAASQLSPRPRPQPRIADPS
jgi:putative tryptophan/tyrosine transport system substrate-binding protein